MVDTKSRGYSNSSRLSEGEYSVPFFSTHPSPIFYDTCLIDAYSKNKNIN